jgi:hypothetical protein
MASPSQPAQELNLASQIQKLCRNAMLEAMATSEVSKDVTEAPAAPRRGFYPGNPYGRLYGHLGGRPRKGTSIKELLRKVPKKDKQALVRIAYERALAGDVHWAEWIAKHSGESGMHDKEGPLRELIIREYAGWPSKVE